jgi:hypothetical protein
MNAYSLDAQGQGQAFLLAVVEKQAKGDFVVI